MITWCLAAATAAAAAGFIFGFFIGFNPVEIETIRFDLSSFKRQKAINNGGTCENDNLSMHQQDVTFVVQGIFWLLTSVVVQLVFMHNIFFTTCQ